MNRERFTHGTPGNIDSSSQNEHSMEGYEQFSPPTNEPLVLRFPGHVYQTPTTGSDSGFPSSHPRQLPSNYLVGGNFPQAGNQLSLNIKLPQGSSRKATNNTDYQQDNRGSGGNVLHHHTLGQMAEQFQERARAVARQKGFDSPPIEDDEEDEDGDEEGGGQQSESTGRWTKLEHELFLEALKKYGKVSKTLTNKQNKNTFCIFPRFSLVFSYLTYISKIFLGVEESSQYGENTHCRTNPYPCTEIFPETIQIRYWRQWQ